MIRINRRFKQAAITVTILLTIPTAGQALRAALAVRGGGMSGTSERGSGQAVSTRIDESAQTSDRGIGQELSTRIDESARTSDRGTGQEVSVRNDDSSEREIDQEAPTRIDDSAQTYDREIDREVSVGNEDISEYPESVSDDVIYPDISLGLGFASESWLLECEGRAQTFNGTLEINSSDDIDVMRCIRMVTGDLKFNSSFDPASDDFLGISFTVLPWLEIVQGNIKVVGGRLLVEIWLPRLHSLGGYLSADYHLMFEGLYLQSMTELGHVSITTRTLNNIFTGFDGVTKVKGLSIDNPNEEDTPPAGTGWNGLVEAGKLKITGYALDPSDGLLNSLTTVTGDVELSLLQPEFEPEPELYGVDQLTSIGGKLWIHDSEIETLDGLGALQSIGGCLVIQGVPNLSASEISAFEAQTGKTANNPNCS